MVSNINFGNFSYSNYKSYNYSSSLQNTKNTKTPLQNQNDLTSIMESFSSKTKSTYSLSSTDVKSFLTNTKSQSKSLSSALNSLSSSNSKSLANTLTATSSDNEKLVTKDSAASNKVDSTTPLEVSVKQVATTQKNQGTALDTEGKDFTTGRNQISIEIDGKSTQVSFNVDQKDTNRDVQQKMADEINKKNIGVKASVLFDEKTKTSSLVMESKNTGTTNTDKDVFSVKDIEGSSFATSGADKVTQHAQNAVYTVNGGKEQLSKSNTIDLGNGIEATLKQASTTPVKIDFQKNTTGIIDAAKDIVNGFNQLKNSGENTKDSGAAKLAKDLGNLANTYKGSLADVGINISKSGNLEIDEAKMKIASESGKLESFFSQDKDAGFSSKLKQISNSVERNPSQYLSAEGKRVSLESSYSYSISQTKNNNSNDFSFNFKYNQMQMFQAGSLFNTIV